MMQWAELRRYCLIVVATWVHPGVAWADASVPSGYQVVAAEHGIPDALFYAVALAESGKKIASQDIRRPWPWTLNVEGQGYYYESRLKAWLALSEWLQRGIRSIDIGLMQVNWRWHEDKLGDTWRALDPYHNLRVGAEILRTCFEARREWWQSVGCYHAPSNPDRAMRYQDRVKTQWRALQPGA